VTHLASGELHNLYVAE